MHWIYLSATVAVSATLVALTPICAAEPTQRGLERISIDDRLPYAQQPIDYRSRLSSDAVAHLSERIDAGSVRLRHDESQGYLLSLLSALEVPVESQLLVFSKTALHPRLVTPKNPRAVYFNDNVSVTWTPGASTLEIAADDPRKGSLFYVVHQDPNRTPRPERTNRCLTCHVSESTLQIPGWMLRSYSTDENGKPTSGYGHVTHATEIKKRWGGWYVTGNAGLQPQHRGNRFDGVGNRDHSHAIPDIVSDLSPFLDIARYPAADSDLVAHLVLDHQAQGKNLITRVAYEARLNRHSDSEEQLVRYLLFADEAPLTMRAGSRSGYAVWFERQGPFNQQGRSLRQFDLETRLFRYRLSYLIYSKVFDGLPPDAKQRLYDRLWQILTGRDQSPTFQHLDPDERAAIIKIVRATKDDLPAVWSGH